jgi:hypothetical protein
MASAIWPPPMNAILLVTVGLGTSHSKRSRAEPHAGSARKRTELSHRLNLQIIDSSHLIIHSRSAASQKF